MLVVRLGDGLAEATDQRVVNGLAQGQCRARCNRPFEGERPTATGTLIAVLGELFCSNRLGP